MEGGSLADKIKKNGHFENPSTVKYLTQILEGVHFLHERDVYHSDIKPANILLTVDDNLKLSDFGIAIKIQLTLKATRTNLRGDCNFISPERINGTSRSAESDIWGVGATFVAMISCHSLNHKQRSIKKLIADISEYKLFINGIPIGEFLAQLEDNDFKKQIITRTLCPVEHRANAQELLAFCRGIY